MRVTIDDHPFRKKLLYDFHMVWQEHPDEAMFDNSRILNNYETYIHNSSRSLNELCSWITKLHFSLERLNKYRKSQSIHDVKALIHDLENHYIRLYSLLDRLYQFLNDSLNLGFKANHVSEKYILENVKFLIHPQLVSVVKDVRKSLAEYRVIRNGLVHREQIKDKDLLDLQAYCSDIFTNGDIWERLNPGKNHSDFVQYKIHTFQTVAGKKHDELLELIEVLEVSLTQILDVMYAIYNRQKQIELASLSIDSTQNSPPSK